MKNEHWNYPDFSVLVNCNYLFNLRWFTEYICNFHRLHLAKVQRFNSTLYNLFITNNYEGKFIHLNVPEMQIIEITGANIGRKFQDMCDQANNPKIIYHIRIYGIVLTKRQISKFFQIISNCDSPYLSFSPKTDGKILDRLYDKSKYDFNFKEFKFKRKPLIMV